MLLKKGLAALRTDLCALKSCSSSVTRVASEKWPLDQSWVNVVEIADLKLVQAAIFLNSEVSEIHTCIEMV